VADRHNLDFVTDIPVDDPVAVDKDLAELEMNVFRDVSTRIGKDQKPFGCGNDSTGDDLSVPGRILRDVSADASKLFTRPG
jgi:hypothetical protein